MTTTLNQEDKKKEENENVIRMVIPPNASEGDVLTFSYNNKSYDISIPPDSVPGDVLQLTLTQMMEQQQPQPQDEDEEEEEDVFELKLGDTTLYFGTKMDTTTDAVAVVTEEEEDDGTNAMCWPAGIHFSKYLYTHAHTHLQSRFFSTEKKKNKKIKVIELGSGQGIAALGFLTGLKNASASSSLSGDDDDDDDIRSTTVVEMVMTDVPNAIPLLQHNWNYNKPTIITSSFSSGTYHIQVNIQSLLWGGSGGGGTTKNDKEARSDDDDEGKKANVIIGSDLLYNSSSSSQQQVLHDLASTMHHYLLLPSSSSSTKSEDTTKYYEQEVFILLAVRWRKPNQERYFFERMEDLGYDFTLLDDDDDDDDDDNSSSASNATTLPCKLSWKEYGNSNSDASNQYFTDTFVSIQNYPKSDNNTTIITTSSKKNKIALKDITEEHVQYMNDEEYNEFERMHTQIYMGQRRLRRTKNENVKKEEDALPETKKRKMELTSSSSLLDALS
mmetsp:Transcript_581/g.938  ORF Transcript_581/g.938 Transcript_581/m.938 type:complete len:500 (-) Transcript_581:59-1558(-)